MIQKWAGTAGLCFLAGVAIAQTSAPPPPTAPATQAPASELQQITVTGYVVPRVGEGTQPVTTIDRDFIEKRADQTVSDVLQRIPENVGNFTPSVNSGVSFSPGGSSISLQGLGPQSTLVLIDGHRQTIFPFPQSGFIPFVDLNSIPLAAVDRIEYLKDGASSVYGSDAIAGVINVILKTEYNGADLNSYYGISQRGDYETFHQQATFGISHQFNDKGAKFNLVGSFDYYSSSPINSADRGYSSNENHVLRANPSFFDYTDRRSTRNTAPFFVGNDSGLQYRVNLGFGGDIPGPGDVTIGERLRPFPYDTNRPGRGAQLVPREQRIGGLFNLNVQPFENLRIYDTLTVARTKENASAAAIPISNTDGINVPADNPFNPFGESLFWDRGRLANLGQRKTYTELTNFRNIVGVSLINLPNEWFVDASFNYAETDGTITTNNFIRKSSLNQALAGQLPGFEGVFLNPFFDTQSGNSSNNSLLNALRYRTRQDARTDLTQWLLTTGGNVIDVPAGPIQAGAGLEYRSQTYVDRKDKAQRFGDIVGTGGSPNQNGRDYDRAAYGQLTIPIFGGKWSWPGMRLLEVILSERYDDYSSFGDAWKPKFSIRYKPLNDLTLRASYSEGFRAPSLFELFSANLTAFTAVNDPFAPAGTSSAPQVQVISGGNPKLQPEVSYGYYAGGVWSPGSTDPDHSWWGWANGLTLYIDWSEIEKRSVIGTVPAQFVVSNPGLFPGAVTRGPDGTILSVNDPFLNLGSIRVDSVSFGGIYNTKEFNWGKLELEVDATYFYHIAEQIVPNGQVLNITDSSPFNGVGPDFHLIASVFYSKRLFDVDTFRTGVTVNFWDSEHDGNDFQAEGIPNSQIVQQLGVGQTPTVGNWTTLDWQISYEFGRPEEVTPETPKPGYDKEGKPIIGEKAIAPAQTGRSTGIRRWLAGTRFTVGINNIFDTRPPFADLATATGVEGFDTSYANYIQRFFFVSVEKKF
jgi:iron complex outermembrane recepter protein